MVGLRSEESLSDFAIVGAAFRGGPLLSLLPKILNPSVSFRFFRRVPQPSILRLRVLTTCHSTAPLVYVEIQAGDGARDHVFLDLNQVAVGVSHSQHGEKIFPAAARDDHQFS